MIRWLFDAALVAAAAVGAAVVATAVARKLEAPMHPSAYWDPWKSYGK